MSFLLNSPYSRCWFGVSCAAAAVGGIAEAPEPTALQTGTGDGAGRASAGYLLGFWAVVMAVLGVAGCDLYRRRA